jgi:hypothetical protein
MPLVKAEMCGATLAQDKCSLQCRRRRFLSYMCASVCGERRLVCIGLYPLLATHLRSVFSYDRWKCQMDYMLSLVSGEGQARI